MVQCCRWEETNNLSLRVDSILLPPFVKLLKDYNSTNDAVFVFYAVWFCYAAFTFILYLQWQSGDGTERGPTGRRDESFYNLSR